MDPKYLQAQVMGLNNATALLQAAKITIVKADMFLTQLPAAQEKAQQAGLALKQTLTSFAKQELGAHGATWFLQIVIISLLAWLVHQNRKAARGSKGQSA